MFFRVAFVICLLALVSASSDTHKQLNTLNETKIVGGRNARRREFPYIVAVHYTSSRTIRCGGAILSDIWVLTAAHCIENKDQVNIIIKAGKYDIKSNELRQQIVPVRGIFIHEDWNEGLRLGDIALLKLARPLEFDEYVKSINLPVQGSEPTGTAILTGWGLTSSTGRSLSVLQVVYLQLLDAKKCEKVFKQFHPSFDGQIHPSNVCTSAGPDGLAACNGDSGGPLVQDGQIVGIAVWGYIPCGNGTPTVYTKVSSFVDWINRKMKNN